MSISTLNLDDVKKNIRQEVDSGIYSARILNAINATKIEIETLNPPKNSMVIFDLDDTMVSLYDFWNSKDFAGTDEVIEDSLKITNYPPIQVVKDFFIWCFNKHLFAVVLTARRQSNIDIVNSLLVNSGYKDYCFDILLRDVKDNYKTIAEFKEAKRIELTEQSQYNIISTVGDQWGDVIGKYSGIPTKLPNRFYNLEGI